MNRFKVLIISTIVLATHTLVMATGLRYPPSERIQHVDVYHGIKVDDPYRWLEEDIRESERVRTWVTAQNELTFGYLETLPNRETLKRRLTELWDYEKVGTPFKKAGRYYMSKNDGLQNHDVILVMDSLTGPERVLFNPNTWSSDGTVALGGMAVNKDGRYVAYGVQEAGSDWRTWKVRDVNTGQDLVDTLENLKFTGVAWDSKSEGFYYAKYPDPDPNEAFQSLNKDMKVMYHRLGSKQSQDRVVYARPEHPDWGYRVAVTDDGRYLILTIWVGTDAKYRISYVDLKQPVFKPVDLTTEFVNDYRFIDNIGTVFYFRTDDQAPRGRIIAVDTQRPQRPYWREIIPQAAEPLHGAALIDNSFVCSYLKDVTTQLRRFDLQGRSMGGIELPGVGSATGFSGEREDTETFYLFQSYAMPPSIFRYDFKSNQSTLLKRAGVKFDTDDYISKQVFYRSKDGTRIPMFITHRRDVTYNGQNPTLLYGYGGFNITIPPRFSLTAAVWMEMGGVYAVANIRGGGEYGRPWHEAGKKMNKQNVFDDFIAAAETLIDLKLTSKEKLAITGRSNGGLLVGACMTQRPDLFAAAIPVVGVMDMLRFDAFTAGRFWTDDYGSAQDTEQMFRYLYGYSPYHNLRPWTDYPATLIVTADTDDRVVPSHSFKFVAQLQHCHQGEDPVLIRIETRAGHGSGKPTQMIIEEYADIYAFLSKHLGMN